MITRVDVAFLYGIVKCYKCCKMLQDLASIADFEHLELSREIHDSRFGDLMFKKIFYSSSVCYDR